MISPLSGNTYTKTESSNDRSGAAVNERLVDEQTFLKLLVTQLKNQDPLNPQDGLQFVTQLAQFSSLEQQIQMRQNLDVIKSEIQKQNTREAETSQA
jgi:flagellar basal-body rod modification protein FlgD